MRLAGVEDIGENASKSAYVWVIDQVQETLAKCEVKMTGYTGQILLLRVYGPRRTRDP